MEAETERVLGMVLVAGTEVVMTELVDPTVLETSTELEA